jgi:hypothetical protein
MVRPAAAPLVAAVSPTATTKHNATMAKSSSLESSSLSSYQTIVTKFINQRTLTGRTLTLSGTTPEDRAPTVVGPFRPRSLGPNDYGEQREKFRQQYAVASTVRLGYIVVGRGGCPMPTNVCGKARLGKMLVLPLVERSGLFGCPDKVLTVPSPVDHSSKFGSRGPFLAGEITINDWSLDQFVLFIPGEQSFDGTSAHQDGPMDEHIPCGTVL